ncbi:MAG: TIGR03936 family radical SAM-associated protein [Acidimicrobiia bacterium]|nr:TIGR03936 family radical SAM-associated protein [Acidimicrobiia bacterium]
MRLRLRYTKLGKVRFLSHRDLARVWERALRRAELPVASTQGFTPRPKLHFGLALSVGHESFAEYIDIDLDPERVGSFDLQDDGDDLRVRLSDLLPVGVDVDSIVLLADGEPSLQEIVTSCTWLLTFDRSAGELVARRSDELLAAPEIPVVRSRKGKEIAFDLRPNIVSLHMRHQADSSTLEAELGTQPRAVRPSELVAALSPDIEAVRVCRTAQWIAHDGDRREPVPSWVRTEVRTP